MYKKLPDSIKQDGLFVLWKYEMKDGQMTKVPYQVNGRRANPADAATFDDYDAVIIEITDDDLDDLRDALDSDVQVIAFARTDVDGLSDYDDDFDLIDEA